MAIYKNLFKIKDYSYDLDYTVINDNDRTCEVFDKLIRLTAKITERYASDIVYILDFIKDAINSDTNYHIILSFNECGVNYHYFDNIINDYVLTANEVTIISNFIHDSIQLWELNRDSESKTITLKRVNIYSLENPFSNPIM